MSERPPEFNTAEKPKELLAKEGVKDKESFLQYFEERGISLEDEIEKRKEEILAGQDMSPDKIESTIKNFPRIMLEYDKAAAKKATKDSFDRLYAKLVDVRACYKARSVLNEQKKKLQKEERKKPQLQKEEVVVAHLKKNDDALEKIQEHALENSSNSLPEEKVKFVDFELTPPPDTPFREEGPLDESRELSPQEKEDQEKFQFDPYGARHDRAVRKLIEVKNHREARTVFSPLKVLDKIRAWYWQGVSTQEEKKYQARNEVSQERSYTPEEKAQRVIEFQKGRPEPEFPSDEEKAFSRPIEHGPGLTPELSDIIQKTGEIQTRSEGRFPLSPLKLWDRIQQRGLERKRTEMEKIEGILMREKEAQELKKEYEESGSKKVSEEEEQAIESAKQWHDAALHNATQTEVLGEPSQGTTTKENKLDLQENPISQEEKNILPSPETSLGEQQPGLKVIEKEQQAIEKELEKMSPEEREQTARGLVGLGYIVQERKNKFFANTMENFAKTGNPESTVTHFFKVMSAKYRTQEEHSREKLNQWEKGSFMQRAFAGVGLGGEILKYARIIGDFAGLTVFHPGRWITLGAQLAGSTFNLLKEVRLEDQGVKEKTRVNDAEQAAQEAWKIYETARSNSKNGKISSEVLAQAYRENLPEDLMERLKRAQPGIATAILEKMVGYDLKAAQGLKHVSRGHLLKTLEDYDRLIGDSGAVDGWGTVWHYAELAGKTTVAGMKIQTAYLLLTHYLPEMWTKIPHFSDLLSPAERSALLKNVPDPAKIPFPETHEGGGDVLSSKQALVADHVNTLGGASRGEIVSALDSSSNIPQQSVGPASSAPGTLNLEKPNIEHVIKVPGVLPGVLEVDGVKMEIPEKPLSIGKQGPEGAIIKHLVSHHSQEISREKAGWLAHRMFDRFMGTDEAKELMKTYGIKDKEGLMKLMTRIKEGNVEIDANGNVHLRNISFIKAAASRVAEVSSVVETTPSLASLQEGLAITHSEPDLETLVNIPGADQDPYEGRSIILQDQGVPKEVIDSISREDLGGMSRDEFEKYRSRVETFLSSGISSEDLAHLRPEDIVGFSEDQFHEIAEHTHKVTELKHAGIHEEVIKKLEKSGSIQGLTIEEVSGGMTVPPGELVLKDARVAVHGGRVFVQDHGTFIDLEKYFNPNFREELKEHNIKNIPVAEKILQGRARLVHIYEKAIESSTALGASAADRQRAGMIQKAMQQLITRTERQYGNVFKN